MCVFLEGGNNCNVSVAIESILRVLSGEAFPNKSTIKHMEIDFYESKVIPQALFV